MAHIQYLGSYYNLTLPQLHTLETELSQHPPEMRDAVVFSYLSRLRPDTVPEPPAPDDEYHWLAIQINGRHGDRAIPCLTRRDAERTCRAWLKYEYATDLVRLEYRGLVIGWLSKE